MNSINFMNVILCLFDSMYRSHSGSFPVTRQGGITRKLPKASSSVEIQRPAVNRFFIPLGVKQR